MALPSKQIQLSLFVNEKAELEKNLNLEKEESLKRQVRAQFHLIGELKRRLDKQEEMISSLVDFLMEDK